MSLKGLGLGFRGLGLRNLDVYKGEGVQEFSVDVSEGFKFRV